MPAEPEQIYPQSAVIPWRRREGHFEVAMITSAGGRRWVFPKGLIDPGETPVSSAAREAEEEAGLVGEVADDSLGRYRYRKWGGVCDVDVYLMRVERELGEWPERGSRRREWVSLESALDRVEEPELRSILHHASERLHDEHDDRRTG